MLVEHLRCLILPLKQLHALRDQPLRQTITRLAGEWVAYLQTALLEHQQLSVVPADVNTQTEPATQQQIRAYNNVIVKIEQLQHHADNVQALASTPSLYSQIHKIVFTVYRLNP